MKIKCPCKNCSRRVIGCHADCNEYKEWREELTDENENIKKEREKVLNHDAHIRRVQEMLRRQHNRK